MNKLVSIIIPVYNAENWIYNTLLLALNQSWKNIEIIVIDDGSTDNSIKIVNSFKSPKIKIIKQNNRGGSAARNSALRESQGNFIQYLDADDILSENKIEVQLNRLVLEPIDTVASCPWSEFYDKIIDCVFKPLSCWKSYSRPVDWLIDAGLDGFMNPPHAWLVPRTIVEKSGPWNESLKRNQDGEYFSRILTNAKKLVFVEEAKVYYRKGRNDSVSSSMSRDATLSSFEAIQMITRNILTQDNSQRARQSCANRYLRFLYRIHQEMPELTEIVLQKIEELGSTDAANIGGAGFKIFHKLFGLRTALRFKKELSKFKII